MDLYGVLHLTALLVGVGCALCVEHVYAISTVRTNVGDVTRDHEVKSQTQRNEEESNNKCVLTISEDSEKTFREEILKHTYNFVYLRLDFGNITINETKYVIEATNWIWTYKGENGAHQYLFLPAGFGYLSFGILWSHTRVKELILHVNSNGYCDKITVGTNHSNQLIGNALGKMTAELSKRNDQYNSSYWCYNQRVWLESTFLYSLCKNSVCTFQTFEYVCCKYKIDFTTKSRHVECGKEHYHLGELWWMLPIIIGELCFNFYPLLLAKVGCKIRNLVRRMAWNKNIMLRDRQFSLENSLVHRRTYNSDEETANDEEGSPIKRRYIYLKPSHPVTFMSTIFSPILYCWDFNGRVVSRLLRLLIIFLPMTLSTLSVGLDFKYAGKLFKEAAEKGALLGFSSMIAGYEASRAMFLYYFGGPVTAISVYVIFGCILICFLGNLENFLERGLFEGTTDYSFMLTMHLKQKERFGRLFVSECSGYKRIHHYLLVQTYMLLNFRFWYHTIVLFIKRWKIGIFCLLKSIFRISMLAHLIGFVIFPIYVAFCILELFFSVLYFAFPVVSCFFILLRAYSISYLEYFSGRSIVAKCLRNILCVPLVIAFTITWYMFCLIFFDGFWFLSKITMFTYSGIIAYPKLSYGYLILAFMALYYLVESVNKFGASYRDLLKVSIEACEKIQINSLHDGSTPIKIIHNKGIPTALYYTIIERHRPRRIQVWVTLLKFVSVVSILAISIELLLTFDKFQELSLVSHVFTVLFICALPKIVRVMCVMQQNKARKKLRQKIQRTVYRYLCGNDESGSDVELTKSFASLHGYEQVDSQID